MALQSSVTALRSASSAHSPLGSLLVPAHCLRLGVADLDLAQGRRLLAAAQAMHVERQRLEGCRVETAGPGGHHPTTSRPHAFRHRLPAVAIEPNRVRQIGSAELEFAFAITAVTRGTLLGKRLLPSGDGVQRLRLTRKRQHVLDHVGDLFVREELVETEARHLCAVRFFTVAANAKTDGPLNLFEAPTPQPIVIVEVGITNEALCAAAMTGCTVVLKRRAAGADGKAVEVRVQAELRQRRCLELFAIERLRRLGSGDVLSHHVALTVAENSIDVGVARRLSRIGDPITDGPDNGGIEGPEPPLRQRLVQLLDGIPLMAGGLHAGDGVDLARLSAHARSSRAGSRFRALRCAASKSAPLRGFSA